MKNRSDFSVWMRSLAASRRNAASNKQACTRNIEQACRLRPVPLRKQRACHTIVADQQGRFDAFPGRLCTYAYCSENCRRSGRARKEVPPCDRETNPRSCYALKRRRSATGGAFAFLFFLRNSTSCCARGVRFGERIQPQPQPVDRETKRG